MTIFTSIKNVFTPSKKPTSNQAALGPVYLKKKEATPTAISKIVSSGGTVSIPETGKTYSGYSGRSSGGSSGGSSRSSIPSVGVSIGTKVTSLPEKEITNIVKETGLGLNDLKRSRLITRNGNQFIETSAGKVESPFVKSLRDKNLLNRVKSFTRNNNEYGTSEINDAYNRGFENKLSVEAWKEFGRQLKNSKSKKGRELGLLITAASKSKVLREPLKFSESFLRRTYQYKDVPAGLMALYKNPSNIKNIPKNIYVDAKETVELLKTSPSEALGRIGSDIFTFKITGKALKVTGKVTSKVATRMNPYFKSFKSGIIKIKAPSEVFVRKGKNVFLKKRITKTTIVNKVKAGIKSRVKIPAIQSKIKVRKAGQFKKFQKGRGITLRKGLLTENALSLAEQTKLAGTKGTIVTAQADKLVSFIKKNKIIRKPIPNEANFSLKLKALLKKYDAGTITKKEFYRLNKLTLKESGKTLLERSLFADPKGLVRFTRLGEGVGEASLRDIFKGNFTLKKAKPQIIVFPEGQIARFPKALKQIVAKLKRGGVLTEVERTKLVRWQTKTSGKWKPIGDIRYKKGVELEVTAAPGETIRRVKKLGVTEINGVKVNIVEGKLIKLNKQTKVLLKKAKRGKITNSEANKLSKSLTKETRLKVRKKDILNMDETLKRKIGRSSFERKPVLPLRRIASRTAIRLGKVKGRRIIPKRGTPKRIRPISRRVTPRKPSPRKPSPRKPSPRTPTPPVITPLVTKAPRKAPPRVPRPAPRKAPPRVPRPRPTVSKPPVRPKIKIRKDRLKQIASKKPTGYNAYAYSRGKRIKLNTIPMREKGALDRASYIVDHSTSARGYIEPTFKKVKKLSPIKSIERGASAKIKARNYRIVKGRRKSIGRKFIEKSGKPRINTRGEVKGLSAARVLKQLNSRKKVVRRKKKK